MDDRNDREDSHEILAIASWHKWKFKEDGVQDGNGLLLFFKHIYLRPSLETFKLKNLIKIHVSRLEYEI